MLEKLLSEIRESNTLSPVLLAEKMDVSIQMIEGMLETLKAQGYLRSFADKCDPVKACEVCALSNMCMIKKDEKTRIWVLQENLKIS